MNMIVISIIIKDLKTILSDKKALAIIIIMPIVLMTILSFALKGSFTSSDESDREKVNIAVVKQYDESKDSLRFINILKSDFLKNGIGEETLDDLIISTSNEVNPEEILFKDFLESDEVSKIISYKIIDENKSYDLLKNGDISAIVFLPEKFVYDMKMNFLTPFRNKLNLKIITHPDRNIDGQIVKAVVEAYTNAVSSVIIGKNVIVEMALSYNQAGGGLNGMNEVMNGMKKAMEGIHINLDNVTVEGRRSISSSDYYSVAIMTMFILYAASHGGRMLLEEKENITLQRMIIAGVSKHKILVGKFITVLLIALVQISVMVIFSHFALKVNWGTWYLVVLISFSAAFAVAGVGVLVAAATYRANNYKMANIFESAIIQGMAILGGSFFPIDVMPPILQKFSFLSLNGIALKSYLKVMVGYSLADIANYIAVLTALGILFILLAVLILREKEAIRSDRHNKIKTVKA